MLLPGVGVCWCMLRVIHWDSQELGHDGTREVSACSFNQEIRAEDLYGFFGFRDRKQGIIVCWGELEVEV